jgi:hypothetical protein
MSGRKQTFRFEQQGAAWPRRCAVGLQREKPTGAGGLDGEQTKANKTTGLFRYVMRSGELVPLEPAARCA